MDDAFLSQFSPPLGFLQSSLPPGSIRQDFTQDIQKRFSSGTVVSVNKDTEQVGLAIYTLSEFDSSIFHNKFAIISHLLASSDNDKKEVLEKLIECLKAKGFTYAVVRIPTDFAWIMMLSRFKFQMTDTVTYLTHTLQDISLDIEDKILPCTPQDESQALVISQGSFCYGRFYNDPDLKREDVDALYQQWVANAFGGQVCDAVYGYFEMHVLLGFVAIKKIPIHGLAQNTVMSVELVCVDKKARGLGIGKKLIHYALQQMKKMNTTIALIDTQGNNIAALNTYISCGFRPGAQMMSFRLLL